MHDRVDMQRFLRLVYHSRLQDVEERMDVGFASKASDVNRKDE